jgi:hypothetical protein
LCSPGPKAPYKEECLDFTSHWIAKEEDYSIEKATEGAINELVVSAKCEELLDLLRNMDTLDTSMGTVRKDVLVWENDPLYPNLHCGNTTPPSRTEIMSCPAVQTPTG